MNDRKRNLEERILDLLYPRHCPVCDGILPADCFVCPECEGKLPYIRTRRCAKCGKPVEEEDELCEDCRKTEHLFDEGMGIFLYDETMGQSYQVKEGDETVSVTVHGNRSVVEPLTADSITATADLTEIVDMNSDPITVPVRVSANGISAGNITANPATIEIELEEMISSDFVITGSSGTTVPAEGYQVGNVTASPEKVTIYGPASIINKIDRVVAPVDVTGISMIAIAVLAVFVAAGLILIILAMRNKRRDGK